MASRVLAPRGHGGLAVPHTPWWSLGCPRKGRGAGRHPRCPRGSPARKASWLLWARDAAACVATCETWTQGSLWHVPLSPVSQCLEEWAGVSVRGRECRGPSASTSHPFPSPCPAAGSLTGLQLGGGSGEGRGGCGRAGPTVRLASGPGRRLCLVPLGRTGSWACGCHRGCGDHGAASAPGPLGRLCTVDAPVMCVQLRGLR